MASRRRVKVNDMAQVVEGKRAFADSGCASQAFASAKGALNERGRASLANIGEVGLQLVCGAGQVRVDRIGFDVMGCPDGVERKCIVGGFNGQVV